jgi:hypothetical protein
LAFPKLTWRGGAAEVSGMMNDDVRSMIAFPRYDVFCQTETWLLLSLVKGSRFQSLQRSRKVIPASRAMRSSSDGHTWRCDDDLVSSCPSTTQ